MNIGIVDYNLAMTRPQEVTSVKFNEDNKSNLDHAVFQDVVDKQAEEKHSQINATQDTETNSEQKDASDQGSNSYEGDGGAKRRKKEEIPVEGKVVRKGQQHFEFKI